MSISDVYKVVKRSVKKIAAKNKYNKSQLYALHTALLDEIEYGRSFRDQSAIGKIISNMPETDFCEITDVRDCKVSKYSTCTCTKVMIFGADKINGERCERFTTKTTSRNCNDGNLKLAEGKCEVSAKATYCKEILSLYEETMYWKSEYQGLVGLLDGEQEEEL